MDDDVSHQDSPKLRQEARQWFNRWLKNDESPVERIPNPNSSRFQAEELACLKQMPWDALNFSVHDHFVVRTKAPPVETLPQWRIRREQLISELRDKTFRWFPTDDIPFDPVPNGGQGGWLDRYGDYQDYEIQSETGVRIRVQWIKARKRSADMPLLIHVKGPADTLSFFDVDELLPVMGHCDVALVNPRLTDRPLDHQEYTNIERTAAWTGRTVAAMQVWDIQRATRWLAEELPPSHHNVVLFAQDDMTIPALYAAVLDPTVDHLIVRHLPESHTHAPPLLNVLRFTDIPEVAAAVAPRRLTVLGKPSAELKRTKSIYEIYERPQACSAAESLAQALFQP